MASTHSSLDMLAPATGRELADLLAGIARSGGSVTPIGGGTKAAFGNPLTRECSAISMRNLSQIVAYEPADMTLSVQSGATIGSVWSVLGERGQTIPIDVADDERETIGGLIATAVCGPRRFGSGSLRDLLIGIEVAYPDGSIGRGGGMVVKNVSGFDMMRMHYGALGTLGIILSANFKVVPAARAEATIRIQRPTITSVDEVRRRFASARVRPIALEARRDGQDWDIAARIEGRSATVESLAQELADMLDAEMVSFGDESRAWWRRYCRGLALMSNLHTVILDVHGLPARVATTAARSLEILDEGGVQVDDVRLSLGLGTVRIAATVPGTSADGLALVVSELRRDGGSAVVMSAPPEVKRTLDAFGLSSDTLGLMRALKEQFDPTSCLNPGRVIAER